MNHTVLKAPFRVFPFMLGIALAMNVQAAPQDPNSGVDLSGGNANWTNISIGCRSSSVGLCVSDAQLISPSLSDAYDSASFLVVDGAFYEPATADLDGQVYTGGTDTVQGLEVALQYYASPSDSVLRSFATFTNPSGSAIALTLSWQNNLGADGNTAVYGSSSGDAVYTTGDRWVVTDDASDGSNDPTTSFALYGPGSPAVTTSAVSLVTVADDAGFEGVVADYSLNVPAGATVAMLWFSGLDSTQAEGAARGAGWDLLTEDSPLLTGLTPQQLSQIANWDFGYVPPRPPEAQPIPSMNQIGLTILIALVGLLAFVRMRSA